MMRMKNIKISLLLVAGLGMCNAALAGGRGLSTTPSPVINKATVNVTENVLIISGHNFGEKLPTVLLADEALEVKRFSAREVVAILPRGITQATYGISVIANHQRSQSTSGPFSVTLSGVGRK